MTPLNEPGTRPTVFETFATTGGNPRARRVGKVMSEPDPTMASAGDVDTWRAMVEAALESEG